MTAIHPPRVSPVRGPVKCEPWCEVGDGHPDAVFHEDQTCWGPAISVPLSHEDMEISEYGTFQPDLEVIAYRSPGEGLAAYLHLNQISRPTVTGGVLDDRVLLTAAEARQLAAGLLQVADQIDGAAQ